MEYNVTASIPRPITEDTATEIVTALEGYSPAVYPDHGFMAVTITLDAADLSDAVTRTATLIHDRLGTSLLSAEAMTTEEFDRRNDEALSPA